MIESDDAPGTTPALDDQVPSSPISASQQQGWRGELWRLVEVFALCGFAFALPLLTVFGDAPEQFAFRRASSSHIAIFGIAITVLPAMGLWLVALPTALLGAKARRVVHTTTLAGLATLAFVQMFRSVALGAPLVLAALAFFAVAVGATWCWPVVRTWARFAAFAPPVALVLFLTSSPTSNLMGDIAAVETRIDSPAPVIMLTLDELPLTSLLTADGSIDEELYPNFAALAADSHWFRNTTAVSNATTYAVPAIVSGKLPVDGTSPVAADHPETLFTLLGGHYDLSVQEVITRLCPTSLCPIVREGPVAIRPLLGDARRVMMHRLSPSTATDDPVAGFRGASYDPDAEVPSHQGSEPGRLQAMIAGLSDSDPRTFHYAHILLPHLPFTGLPSGRTYRSPNPDIGRLIHEDQWNDQQWPPTLGRQRHVLQLQFLDRLLGDLLDALREEDLYDDALIVVVADHGVSFEAGQPIRALGGQDLDLTRRTDLLLVPFFLKEPGQSAGRVHDTNVLTIDVLPTIAEVLGADVPFDVDGQSALSDPRATSEKTYFILRHGSPPAHLGPFTFDGAETWPDALERSVEDLLPHVGDPLRAWRIGPAPELVGLPVADMTSEQLRPIDGTAEPFGDGAPALVMGRPEGDDATIEVGTPIAVAVDGVIGATVPVYLEEGRPAIAAMVDEDLFSNRDSEIDLYVIE